MSSEPRVSVIIPCHNLGRYLDEAVDSVFAQTFRDYEILVADVGSTEPETRELIARFERPRCRTFSTENRGPAAARNFLVERARGKLLCALDADDRLHPEFLAKAVATLERDPSLTFVSSWLRAFGDEEWEWRQDRCDLVALLAEDTVLTAAVVRAEAVRAVGGYDEEMPSYGEEDWELWLRLVKAGYRGTILPEVLFFYRRRAGSITTASVLGETHMELMRYVFAKHWDAYREHLVEVLLLREREIGELLLSNHRLELELGRLGSQLALRRDELARLEHTLDSLRGGGGGGQTAASRHQLAALDAECRRAVGEVAALRGSLSWRATAPGRWLYDLFRGRRPGGRP